MIAQRAMGTTAKGNKSRRIIITEQIIYVNNRRLLIRNK